MDGVLLVDKSSGPTSFDVVRQVKRGLGMRKVGHAGTLDPMASGLLVVCTGRCTRLVPYLMDSPKEYRATIGLGMSTTTDDAEGEPLERKPVPPLVKDRVLEVLATFTGHVSQVPPAYSALKRDGEALYKKARRGETVEVSARMVEIYKISLVSFSQTEIFIDVSCGKGTYIRSLARDIGVALDTSAHLTALRRTATSGFKVERAISFDDLQVHGNNGTLSGTMMSGREAMDGYPEILLSSEDEALVRDGRQIDGTPYGSAQMPGDVVCLIDQGGRLLAIAEPVDGDGLRMVRVFPD